MPGVVVTASQPKGHTSSLSEDEYDVTNGSSCADDESDSDEDDEWADVRHNDARNTALKARKGFPAEAMADNCGTARCKCFNHRREGEPLSMKIKNRLKTAPI